MLGCFWVYEAERPLPFLFLGQTRTFPFLYRFWTATQATAEIADLDDRAQPAEIHRRRIPSLWYYSANGQLIEDRPINASGAIDIAVTRNVRGAVGNVPGDGTGTPINYEILFGSSHRNGGSSSLAAPLSERATVALLDPRKMWLYRFKGSESGRIDLYYKDVDMQPRQLSYDLPEGLTHQRSVDVLLTGEVEARAMTADHPGGVSLEYECLGYVE